MFILILTFIFGEMDISQNAYENSLRTSFFKSCIENNLGNSRECNQKLTNSKIMKRMLKTEAPSYLDELYRQMATSYELGCSNQCSSKKFLNSMAEIIEHESNS